MPLMPTLLTGASIPILIRSRLSHRVGTHLLPIEALGVLGFPVYKSESEFALARAVVTAKPSDLRHIVGNGFVLLIVANRQYWLLCCCIEHEPPQMQMASSSSADLGFRRSKQQKVSQRTRNPWGPE